VWCKKLVELSRQIHDGDETHKEAASWATAPVVIGIHGVVSNENAGGGKRISATTITSLLSGVPTTIHNVHADFLLLLPPPFHSARPALPLFDLQPLA
jgi:hypothetical protein